MKLLQNLLFFAACISLVTSASALELKTKDGLKLLFAADGTIPAVVDGSNKIPAKKSGGVFLRVAGTMEFSSMRGKVLSEGKGRLTFVAKDESLNVGTTTQFENHGDYISIDGFVKNPAANERAVDLKLVLPIDARGWNWGIDLAGEEFISQKIKGLQSSDGITVYPLAPISNTNSGTGVCLAVPPDHPTLFESGADQDGLFLTFKIGLSPDTNPPNETKFRMILFRHDPRWGFRSALQRYYDIFHNPYFERRVKKIGAWGWHYPVPPSQLPNAKLYAFHEAAGEVWKLRDEGKHGYEHEGDLRTATRLAWQKDANAAPGHGTHVVADFEQLAKFADDQKFGIYSLPYTMVGQRQVYHLPRMPSNRDQALAAFEQWAGEPMLIQSPPPAVGFRTAEQLKEIIRNSGIYDDDQKPTILMREYLGNTLSFPQNPNPRLFFDTAQMTVAKYTLNDYLPMLFNGTKFVDGCYVDSLGRWPGYFNFRREHFKYSTVPLTYSTQRNSTANETDEDAEGKMVKQKSKPREMSPKPCLWNLQSHAEYLWELSRRLHAENKIVFANGIHINRVMLGFAVDALGMEGLPNYKNRNNFYSGRVAAGQKPYCALNGRDNTSPAAWNSCLYLGILIGARSEEGQKLERQYLPTIIRINEAGWEPVTLARAEDSAIGVERWGRKKELYFTVMNRSTKEADTILQVDGKALGLGKKMKAIDLMSGEEISFQRQQGDLLLRLQLGPEKAKAIAIK